MQHAATGVLDVAYEAGGPADTPVVLLLHGWPDDLRGWRGVALAHDAIALMDRLGIARLAVAGHDWGARAAYTLAALFPAPEGRYPVSQ